MASKNILCVCLGNSDRSPYMAGGLKQMLNNQGGNNQFIDVLSAGVLESAKSGGSAPQLSVELAPTYGLDLSEHRRKHVDELNLDDFDLFIAADLKVAEALYVEHGVRETEIICLDLEGGDNAWLSKDSRKVEAMIASIYYKLIVRVIQYKFRVE